MVFCDISKAFDRVWHRGLLAKLYHYGITGNLHYHYGITGNLHKWFDRFQRVTIPGGCSEWVEIKVDVPQGSILGPYLSLLYINYIVHEFHSNIRLFADHTTIYIIVDFPGSAVQSSCGHGTKAVIQNHKSINEWRIRMFRPTDMDPRRKGVIRRPRIVSITW